MNSEEFDNYPAKTTVYVLVRTDLSLEQQLVQSSHAVLEAGRSLYGPEHGIASVIVLAVADQAALYRAHEELLRRGVECELFFEPDFDMGHSALATQPLRDTQRRLLRKWPLWRAAPALAHE